MHCLQGGKIVSGLLIKDGQPGLAALLVLVLQRVQSKYACSTLTFPGVREFRFPRPEARQELLAPVASSVGAIKCPVQCHLLLEHDV